jgi:pimeloyl-ACP methyl ester carboxylesterase
LKLTDEQVGEHAWAQYCQSLSHSGPAAKIDNLVALELDLAASPSTVRQVLRALYYDHRLAALPVAALVTPEAATKTIVDWVVYGDVTAPFLQRLARHWIPVAAGTYFLQAMEDDADDGGNRSSDAPQASVPLPKRSVFSSLDGWPVLSVFGVGDPESEQAAHRLRGEIVSASALKLRGGGRACYLQYPEDFLAEIQRYLEVDEAPASAATVK